MYALFDRFALPISKFMKSFGETFCIVDTETTGMRSDFSRIIDIGIIRVEKGKVVKRYETLINPGFSLPRIIVGITSITDEDLAQAPPFEDVALEIQEMLKDAIFVAHNATFDYGFIKAEFQRIGINWKAPTLCSVKLSRALFPEHKRHNLDELIKRHAIICSDRHRAMPDAEVVLSFFEKINKKFPARRIQDEVAKILGGTSTKNSLSNLPDSAGVYFFYGDDQELLYIGKSKHIRTRVRSHFHKTPIGKEKRIQGETSLIETVKTSGELSALILEATLIKSQSPVYNRALRNRKKLIIARIKKDELGYNRIFLESTADLSPDGNTVSVFRSMSQAKSKLQELAKENKLCEKLLNIDRSAAACFSHQLRMCDGACIGKISSSVHNKRIDDVFKNRRIRTWPYAGCVLITEQDGESSGTVFFIDNWILRGAFRFDGDSYERLINEKTNFDYDTYKILTRYLLNKTNSKHVRVLTPSEYKSCYAKCIGHYEEEVYT
jgi:DNA polymerase-3 subunit epsilon